MFVVFINTAAAQEVEIVKESLKEIKFGETLEVKIGITNPSNFEKLFEVTEKIPQGMILVEPEEPDKVEMNNALIVNLFIWTVEIPPEETSELIYKIKPAQLGSYTLTPTVLRDKSTNEIYLSQSLSFFVGCTPNNICEKYESFFTCPEDCGSGEKDGVCVYKADGICDPDCSKEPDCKAVVSVFSSLYLWISIIIVLIILITIVILKIKKKSKKEGLS